ATPRRRASPSPWRTWASCGRAARSGCAPSAAASRTGRRSWKPTGSHRFHEERCGCKKPSFTPGGKLLSISIRPVKSLFARLGDSHLCVVAPCPLGEVRSTFPHAVSDRGRYKEAIARNQEFRGRIYLDDGAIPRSDLSEISTIGRGPSPPRSTAPGDQLLCGS